MGQAASASVYEGLCFNPLATSTTQVGLQVQESEGNVGVENVDSSGQPWALQTRHPAVMIRGE